MEQRKYQYDNQISIRLKKEALDSIPGIMKEFGIANRNRAINFCIIQTALLVDVLEELEKYTPYATLKQLREKYRPFLYKKVE